MKYLEENALTWLNSVLGSYEIGDRVLCSKIEAYSCKKAGSDKKLAKHLELYYQQELEALAAAKDAQELLSSSPLGPLAAPATRKLLINLISTMNASFPDYDFSAVKPEQFRKEADYRLAIQRINHDLAELIDAESNGFVEKLWEAIAETIKLEECEVYSYIPDMDSDPFSDGTLYVQYRLDMIVCMACIAMLTRACLLGGRCGFQVVVQLLFLQPESKEDLVLYVHVQRVRVRTRTPTVVLQA